MPWSFNNVNRVILIGHLGKDPELSYLPSGQSVAKFTMATSRSYKDKSGEWKKETEWHNIVAWGKLGELCAQHLKKGRQAYVEGQIRSHSWEDREGKKRTAVDIVVDSVVPLGSRGEESGAEPVRAAAPARAATAPDDFGEPASQEITDDDIPF
jgi:single-strand DNA-binding protein